MRSRNGSIVVIIDKRCQPAFLSMLRYLYLSHSET
jgi:hypothetical protein